MVCLILFDQIFVISFDLLFWFKMFDFCFGAAKLLPSSSLPHQLDLILLPFLLYFLKCFIALFGLFPVFGMLSLSSFCAHSNIVYVMFYI